jgi:hypothetical protein
MSNLQATSNALEKAIQANLDIQAELIAKLRHIAQVKQNNRLQCTKIKSALERHLDSRIDEELGNKNNADETTAQTEGNVKSYMNKQWNDNDNLKWKRRYFVDPERSKPEPNDDEIRRRTWEGDLASGDYVNRLVPWSKIEINALIECAEEVRKEQQQEEENDLPVKDADIDFHKVAARVEAKLSKKKFTPSQMARHTYSLPDGTTKNKHIPRSWVDYRIKFLCSASPSINKRPFTKAESLKIIELLHSYDGDPPWHLVARTLGTSRTPFQCFQHAQIKLTNTLKETGNTAMLTKDEDELLFKFIAASGPQFVLNTYSTVMVQKMFPHANHNRIMLRAHMSLMNPQFANENWSEREERMLALGMKVYDGCEMATGKAGVSLMILCYLFATPNTHSLAFIFVMILFTVGIVGQQIEQAGK